MSVQTISAVIAYARASAEASHEDIALAAIDLADRTVSSLQEAGRGVLVAAETIAAVPGSEIAKPALQRAADAMDRLGLDTAPLRALLGAAGG